MESVSCSVSRGIPLYLDHGNFATRTSAIRFEPPTLLVRFHPRSYIRDAGMVISFYFHFIALPRFRHA